ncbi:hypothetical protein [Candidatus Nitrosocosmicus sp. FF01]|uniref:hypothetical protein n=1 Tax=Candidatus Nitrosocosmicus sp. FF01 TaxID=3397670 RepID=UPI0039E94DB6
MTTDSNSSSGLFEDRGLRNQRSDQTRGRKNSTRLSKEQRLNKNICCEAIFCDFEATEKISLSAGKFGTLEFFVCKKCIDKFNGSA